MSNTFNRILWVGVVLLLAACRSGGLYPSAGTVFAEQSSAWGFYVEGRQALVYDQTIHQMARRGASFRIQTDDQSVFINLQLDQVPLAEQSQIQGTLTARGVKGLVDQAYTFEQIERRDGKIWLWNEASKIGVIIPIFE